MKISIITVSYNSEETIRDTLESVVAQDYPQVEYIVVDGLSKDKTPDIITSYGSKISCFISEKDEGIYDAINKGIRASTGDVVGLLHSDDLFAGDAVLSGIAKVFMEGNTDAVYADLNYVHRDNTDKVLRHWKAGEYVHGLFKNGWMPPHPTFYVKKDCYNRLGCYNTGLKLAADYELMLRFIHKHQIKTAYIPEVLVKMRMGGESNISLSNRIKANKEDMMAWKINDLKPGPFTRIMKPLSKIRQFF